MHTSVICKHCPSPTYGDGRGIAMLLYSDFPPPPRTHAQTGNSGDNGFSSITVLGPAESHSPALYNNKFNGVYMHNDWCIIHLNKDEILDKIFVVFISFISQILYKIIEETQHNRLVIFLPHPQPTNGKGTYCFGASPNYRHRR